MTHKININRLLENSQRSDVHGYNIWTRGKKELKRLRKGDKLLKQWDDASLGLEGVVAIAHHLDIDDLIAPQISANDTELTFDALRNHWTPAFMDTMYRCRPFGEYTRSGLIAAREKKCFDEHDTFISHLTLFNDGRKPIKITINLSVPFNKIADSTYSVNAKIAPLSLGRDLFLKGYVCAKTDCGENATITVPAFGKAEIRYGFAFSKDSAEKATKALENAFAVSDPFVESEKRFNNWMDENAPELLIDNTDILKIYYYRFFVIKTAIHSPSDIWTDSTFQGPCVYESPFGGWFGAPIGLPIPLQIEEMKWMKNIDALRSHIKNWCEGYGATQNYIQSTPMSVWDIYVQTGDKSIISEFYDSMKKFTLRKYQTDKPSLPLTDGSWITGAEYQPSFYQHTEPKWDWRFDTEGEKIGYHRIILNRVDECSMHLLNLRACEMMASTLENKADEAYFSACADEITEMIRNLCWNEEKGFFFDFNPEVGKQCDEAYGYDGFMPIMKNLFGKEYYKVFEKLMSGERFDSGFAATSIGKDCPMYWFDNCITGPTASTLAEPHPYGCCWNGPVWPFANSLVLDALGNATYYDRTLKDTFNRLFLEYTELHFNYGDRSTPCIVEHYRPTDGAAFSPQAEYFHSEWINLFLSYYIGIRVTEDDILFEPLTDEEFVINNICIKGKCYNFSQSLVDGEVFKIITEA